MQRGVRKPRGVREPPAGFARNAWGLHERHDIDDSGAVKEPQARLNIPNEVQSESSVTSRTPKSLSTPKLPSGEFAYSASVKSPPKSPRFEMYSSELEPNSFHSEPSSESVRLSPRTRQGQRAALSKTSESCNSYPQLYWHAHHSFSNIHPITLFAHVPFKIASSSPEEKENFASNSCIICRVRLIPNDRAVRTDYGLSHLECFRCHECHESLEHSQFYFSDSSCKFYCHLDYHETHSPRCAYCDTPIEARAIMAMDRAWHPDHFFCTQCSKTIKVDEPYFIIDKLKVCCTACHEKKTSLTCWKCKFASDQLIDALGRTWCSSCFICDSCTKALDEEFILREDGDIVCKACEVTRIKLQTWS